MTTKTILVLAIAAAFVAGTITTGTIVLAETETITACVKKKGTIKIVDSPDDCKKNQTPLEWNIQGPSGEGSDVDVTSFQRAICQIVTFLKRSSKEQTSVMRTTMDADFTGANLDGTIFTDSNLEDAVGGPFDGCIGHPLCM